MVNGGGEGVGAWRRSVGCRLLPEEIVEEAWASRRPSGRPDWEFEGWVSSYLAIAAGELETNNDVVPRLAGQPARTLVKQLRAQKDWGGLR